MMGRRLKIIWCLVVLLALSSCLLKAQDENLRGWITLWHSWTPAEVLILEETLDQFQEIHPDVHISAVAFPQDQVITEFIAAGEDGLGPTLLLGIDSSIGDLVDAGMIRPVSPSLATLDLFNTRNVAITRYKGQQYGVPLALAPHALYYNKSLVSAPPETLDELLDEADAGRSIAFVPRFSKAFWGIQTFGDGLFDENGRFTLAESGFAEWLGWLDEAQSSPGVILNVDDEALMGLFASGQVAYYIAGPENEAATVSMIDQENPFKVGVSPLPGNPESSAGPLLTSEVIMFYKFSSPEERIIADELAAFLVNQQQSLRFLRELERVPANPDIWVDRRIYPNVYGFSQQARTAVVIPNEVPADPFLEAGNRAYVNVLSGALTPEEAVCSFGREVSEFMGYTIADVSVPEGCQLFDDGK